VPAGAIFAGAAFRVRAFTGVDFAVAICVSRDL
jgi:hypothetical protein